MINIKWHFGLKTQEAKEKREAMVRGSVETLDLLSQIIEQEIINLAVPKFEDYDSPSWAYKEADRLGQLRTYNKLLKLTQLDKE